MLYICEPIQLVKALHIDVLTRGGPVTNHAKAAPTAPGFTFVHPCPVPSWDYCWAQRSVWNSSDMPMHSEKNFQIEIKYDLIWV